MQLERVVVYSHDARVRSIDFNAGGLNVLTGESKTGKSALLDIVEFCLGRSTFLVPAGPITQRVAWYGILLVNGETRIWIARPAPTGASSGQAMLEIGSGLEIPPFESLVVNADVGAVRSQLDSMLGIEEFEVEAGFGSFGNAYRASSAHAITFCFQQQGEIASQDYLFHRQSDLNWAIAIRNTLPYFLGAVPADYASKKSLLAALKKSRARDVERLRQLEVDFSRIEGDLQQIYQEALSFGLVPEIVGDRTAMVDALRTAAIPQGGEIVTPPLAEARRSLREERSELLRRQRALGEQRNALDQLDKTEREFHAVVEQQITRLEAAHVIPSDDSGDEHFCPLCLQHLQDPDPRALDMITRQIELRDRLSSLDTLTVSRQSVGSEIDDELQQILERLAVLDRTEREIVAAQRSDEQSRSTSEAREFRRGRVSVALDRLDARDGAAIRDLRASLEAADLQLDELETELGSDAIADLLAAKSNVLSEYIEVYARELDLEHSQWPLRLDLKKLTVVADTPDGSIDLTRIGSGENWVGYHLVAHMALHRVLKEADRPVPSFLMLDQPSQAHYPPDATPGDLPDHDRLAVTNMFRQLHDFAAATGVQVIVCDHAELADAWYQASIVETWRDGTKLVPEDWPES